MPVVYAAHAHRPGGADLADGAYVAALARRDSLPAEAGPHIWPDPAEYVDATMVFRQLFCPGCLTAVDSRVVPVAHPLPDDSYRL